jgi:hypothetical protein
MWKPEHRIAADRRTLRYPSDMSDAEWALVAPSSCAERWAQAFDRRARGSQRHLLRAGHRLPVAGVAQGLTAQEYGAFLFHAVGLERRARLRGR